MDTYQTRTVFFGSTTDSVLVLDYLSNARDIALVAVVTQPPKPVGRSQQLAPTPVETWAQDHGIPALSFPNDQVKPWRYADESTVIDTLEPLSADLVISASYGQMIPADTIAGARFGGLNVHPSVLPRWRGGDPVPWAIMTGDRQTGVTIVSLSEKFDEGLIYAQEKIPISPKDTSTPLRTRLFDIGARKLVEILPMYLSGSIKGKPQKKSDEPRATRLSRETGYESWSALAAARTDEQEAQRIERKFRALHPWPGVWSVLTDDAHMPASQSVIGKRLIIRGCRLRDGGLEVTDVQLEGKNPVSWSQFRDAYITASPDA